MTDRPTALIADDEQPLRDFLQRRLAEAWPELRIVAQAQNGLEAVERITEDEPDIAFLDIKMPGLTGLEVASQVIGKCHLVFVTSFDDYAVEAFDREAIDYLVKPVSAERLAKTIERLKKRLTAGQSPSEEISRVMESLLAQLPSQPSNRYLKWIKVPHGGNIRLVSVDDIHCFKASDKYTLVYTAEGESLINTPIKALVDQLDPDLFWQIHRGTIIRVDRILSVSRSLSGRYQVKVDGVDEILTVSRNYTALFKQM